MEDYAVAVVDEAERAQDVGRRFMGAYWRWRTLRAAVPAAPDRSATRPRTARGRLGSEGGNARDREQGEHEEELE